MARDDWSFSIDLPVRDEWSNVELLRSSILNCLTAVFGDYGGCQAVAIVTSELLENAVKYGQPNASQHPLRLKVSGRNGHARVVVENPASPNDPRVTELQETIEWAKGFPSPLEAYRARLLKVANSAGEASKLGLVRVLYEGNCRLQATVDGDVVRVTADIEL